MSIIKGSNKKISSHGFTLIELLIAIAVFFIGILAAFSLSLNNLNRTKDNFNRVIAADLAREGIEIVRNIRDSNWLKREANIDNPDTIEVDIYAWDQGLDSLTFFTSDYLSNGLVSLGGGPLDLAIDQPEAKVYLKNGFYTHDSTGGQATIFSRALSLQAICLNTASMAETLRSLSCDASEVKIGLQITSRVKYSYSGKTNQVDAIEKIYNWR